MGARTGAQYIADLKAMKREIWIGGEKVEDVTAHPATRRGVASYAHLYDMQHNPALRDVMTYSSPTGNRVGTAFLTPRTPTDLALRREMMRRWANYSGGMLGRTPDYISSAFMAMAAASEYFAANDPRFGENIRNYYEYIREHDLCLTHTLINPQANRSKGVHEQADPYLPAGIVTQNEDGIVIRGCRLLATSAPLADEIMVFPSTVVRSTTDAEKYAFAFSIPTDTPGMKFICRESLDTGESHFDRPLASRFEEMDAIVIFDDVLVPWERVFLLGDMERCNNCFGATDAVLHMMHQVVIKDIAKAEFLLGVILMMIETVAIEQFQHVQEKAAEVITYLETMKACLRAGEADAHLDQWGVMAPARMPLDVARNMFPRMYPRIKEIVQLLGASGLMATATEADFAGPLGADAEKYLQAATAGGKERVRLYRLAWEIACSGFGGRQELYERYFFGDPVRMMSALYFLYDKEPLKQRIRDFLHQEYPPATASVPPPHARASGE